LRLRTATFRALCSDCRTTLEVVARFLALLELYREGLVGFDQVQALGELTVRWIGDDAADAEFMIDEYDDEQRRDQQADDEADLELAKSAGGEPAADDSAGSAEPVDSE